ncbi:uncharacterized protein LOC111364787 isoform X1 [Spodoptera litura]|uniref:Uncharacterized protein LOC111364787 isoform X1 n=1 Tax=Spodoptera litura TaxID=69820 RepID=A0A9J7J4W0_SPOLT|nr:uncharacterized protein LOC111364787 isoform X1 [Spodoptera litura]
MTQQILHRVLARVVKKLQLPRADISIKNLTSGGANITSALYSVTITAPDHAHLKLFAKVADVNVDLRKQMNIESLYTTEQIVYNHLVGVYQKVQDKYHISPEHRFVFPKFYGGEDTLGQETVVMEDMTSSGYAPYSRFESIDWEHAAVAVEDLARLHALSFAYKKEDPGNFAMDTKRLRFARDKMDFSGMKKTWRQIGESAMEVVKEEHRNKLSKIIDDRSTQEVFFRFRAPLSTVVLCHGDYRVSNLLFRRVVPPSEGVRAHIDDRTEPSPFRQFGSPVRSHSHPLKMCGGSCATRSNMVRSAPSSWSGPNRVRSSNGRLQQVVVDYQTVHSGCPVTDLLYLEFLGTDQAFRNKYHDRLYDYYFSELTKALDRYEIDINKVYPRATFEKEIKEMYSVALTIAMVVLPLVLVDTDRAPLMSKIEGVSDFAIKPSQLFATRFRELVSDCIEWGGL